MLIPQQLQDEAKKVNSGGSSETTVRTLLSWFGAYRRSWRNIKAIREAMDKLRIYTCPDFEGEYIDGTVHFKPISAQQEGLDTQSTTTTTTTTSAPTVLERTVEITATAESQSASAETKVPRLDDPAHRISRLPTANRPPIYVSPDATVAEAITIMLRHDYSQLPVIQSLREVKGLISWKSLGARLALGRSCVNVRDCMEECRELSSNASMFDAVRIIDQHDCVIVRAQDKTVCGIITAYDINSQFQQLTQPFLLLGDIENYVRYLIDKTFSVEELQKTKDPTDVERKIDDVSDLTFGEYVRLFQDNDNWKKLKLSIDRKTFTKWLDEVRVIRNDIMHFDPDPIKAEDLNLLTEIAHFLQCLHQLNN